MPKAQVKEIANVTRGTVLGSEYRIANTALSRMVGLLRDRGLRAGSGLLIAPCSGVHTFGMRFPIDVVALDRRFRVLGLWENLGACRIAAAGFRTHKVLELPVGAIRQSRTEVNDQLVMQEAETSGDTLTTADGEGTWFAVGATNSTNPTERSTRGERV